MTDPQFAALLAGMGALLAGVFASFWKLWTAQQAEHRKMREEDRADRKDLVDALHKLRGSFHGIGLELALVREHLGLDQPEIEVNHDDTDTPVLRVVPANGKKKEH